MVYISYVFTEFGIIEIRATSRKILSVLFVDEVLENVSENELTKKCAKQIEEYFSCKRREFEIPIEISGTEFEKKVLTEVLKIPYGTVTSYKAIAQKIGNENAFRAVGNIIGKYILLLLIPCHRVIGSNGKMRGYVTVTEKKQAILDFEKENV